MNPVERLERLRAALLAQDDATQARMAQAYESVERALEVQITLLETQMRLAEEQGKRITASMVFRMERYTALLDQTREQVGYFAQNAQGIVESAQQDAITRATSDLRNFLEETEENYLLSLPQGFLTLPTPAIEAMVGNLEDGTPLSQYFARYGESTTRLLTEEIIIGIGLGEGAGTLAARLRRVVEMPRERARLTARTEMLRAYNTAALANYRQHSPIVKGWQWMATLDTRTCLFCLAMHGSDHALDEPMESHISCRCTVVPITLHVTPLRETGQDWFDSLDDRTKRLVAGTQVAYDALSSGKLRLIDYADYLEDSIWGKQGVILSTEKAIKRKEIS